MTGHLKNFVIENPTLIRGQVYERVKQQILSADTSRLPAP